MVLDERAIWQVPNFTNDHKNGGKRGELPDFLSFLAGLVVWAGSFVCHQLPERSFFWDGRQYPVCARCTGLYLSGLAGFVAWGLYRWRVGRPVSVEPRRARRVLIAASVPTVVSLATAAIGLWDGNNATRAAFAVPLGLVAGGIVAAVVSKDLR